MKAPDDVARQAERIRRQREAVRRQTRLLNVPRGGNVVDFASAVRQEKKNGFRKMDKKSD